MGKTILLADDSITIQKIVNLTFSGEGIDVVTVGNGDAALKKVYDVRPDLVLADIFMPGKNGYEVCEHIKNDSELLRIPVILLVGAFEPFDSSEATRVKADGHLTKPFEIKVLISAVNSLISAAEEEKVTEGVREFPEAETEIPSIREVVASPTDELGEPIEPEAEIREALPSAVNLEPAVSVAGLANVAESSYSVATGVMLEEPAVESGQRQDLSIEESRPEIRSITLEDSDPLGLYTTEPVPEEASSEADRSVDSKSFVVDIWEHRSSYAEETEPLPAMAGEEQKGQVGTGTARLQERLNEEEIPDAVAIETSPTSLVSGKEDLDADKEAVVASETLGSKTADLPSGKESDQSELVDLLAHKVIEKLSREVIEKIAWEVIPDMAEIIIKEYTESHLKSTGQI